MTEVSRGARSRRGDRGNGWFLLTALLVLAIGASSTLVFTNRVELLRLAVILALWAAVVAAFVTVIYRRQSELDQARARDMKAVYDLQLDREISARREYELSVESHLRRTLSREIRAEAADEMAALRAELAGLRSQLEVMLGTDLAPRPALESERIVIPMPAAPGRVESRRVVAAEEIRTTVYAEDLSVVDTRIIDVHEEPLDQVDVTPPPVDQSYDRRGSHRRPIGDVVYEQVDVEPDSGPPEVASAAFEARTEPTQPGPDYVSAAPRSHTPAPPRGYTPAPPPKYTAAQPPVPDAPWRPPEVRLGRHSSSDGQASAPSDRDFAAEAAPEPPRGRHWVPAAGQPVAPGRHRPSEEAAAEPVDEEPQGEHQGGQSFAELMARFQVNPPSGGGGGRRRRED